MSSLNKVQLIGHLGRDPEVRYNTSGTAIARINLATSERYKDSSGQQQESTEWHRIVAFARRAEVMAEYLRKGSKVYIEGRIQTRSYEDKNSQTRYVTEIVANDFIFLDSKPSSGGTADNRQAPPEASTPQEGGNSGQQDWDQDFEDSIPF